jgi:hypothetical protein
MSSGRLTLLLIGLLGGSPACPAEQPAPALAEQIAAIQKAHRERETRFYNDLRKFREDDKKITELNQEYQKFTSEQADKLRTLIRGHARAPEALDGILVLVGDLRYYLDEDLVRIVLEHHLANPRMGQLCFEVRYRSGEPWAERILTETAAKHPQHAVRGQATYALADYYRPKPYGNKLSEAEENRRLREAEKYFKEVAERYADVPTPDGRSRLGKKADDELARLRNLPNLKVGKVSPEITGEDLDGKPFKLSDYRGKVVLLDFWGHW